MISGPLRMEIITALVEKTREGRVQDWVERIAVIVKSASFLTEKISWCASPEIVANEVVDYADRCNGIARLQKAIEEYQLS